MVVWVDNFVIYFFIFGNWISFYRKDNIFEIDILVFGCSSILVGICSIGIDMKWLVLVVFKFECGVKGLYRLRVLMVFLLFLI